MQLAEKCKEEKVKTKEGMVAVNERGRRIGEGHPRAKLDDHEIDLIQELLEDGMSLQHVADKFDISKGTVCDIRSGRRRSQYPANFKRAKR